MGKSITFRVTDAEHEQIFECSAALNKTASDLIRLLVFKNSEHTLHLENRNVALENEVRKLKENYSKNNG
ncbi:hypothetical protein K4H28_04610 [Deefgea tanakiae]|uniref:Uncharacterized protein n=1 Tax=Deefgea tanakiae TaxID=2865840 RepID=A0ABX8ZC23_9NEIS|nr:hypothetical protein [Deefgea tanakiae]QZA78698.1 hypothetical protein K4H28_04610 [Deefgea tanakiae]